MEVGLRVRIGLGVKASPGFRPEKLMIIEPNTLIAPLPFVIT